MLSKSNSRILNELFFSNLEMRKEADKLMNDQEEKYQKQVNIIFLLNLSLGISISL